MSRIASALLLGFLGAALLNSAETPATALLVLSKGDHVLTIVDPATLKPVAQVPSGPDPHEVIASADGKTAYISNYGGGAFHTITVVDLVKQVNEPIIDLGPLNGPHGLEFVGGRLWFTAEGAKVIGRYDPETKKIDWVLGTGQDRTHMIFVWPDLEHIVTSNVSSGTMSFIERTMVSGGPGPQHMDWRETVVPVGKGSEGFDVSPDSKEIWVANAGDGTVSIIDRASKKVIQTLNANVRGANRLKFTPNGKTVLISVLGGPDLVVIDAASRKEIKRVRLGRGAAGILMQPDGTRAFVACTPDDNVAVINLNSLEVTDHVSTGLQPDGMAWAFRN